MDTPLDMAHHLNMVRMNQTNGEVRRIPDVGYNVYKKNYQEPKMDEGFTEINGLNLFLNLIAWEMNVSLNSGQVNC